MSILRSGFILATCALGTLFALSVVVPTEEDIENKADRESFQALTPEKRLESLKGDESYLRCDDPKNSLAHSPENYIEIAEANCPRDNGYLRCEWNYRFPNVKADDLTNLALERSGCAIDMSGQYAIRFQVAP